MFRPAKLIIVLLISIQAMNLNAQNHYIKFFAFSVLFIDNASVSYEYSINKNNHIGIQLSASSLANPFHDYTKVTARFNLFVNYRYYYLVKNRFSLFTQLETGISRYEDGDAAREFYANDIGGGVLLGLRKTIGSEKKWSFDFGVGFDYLKRDYYRVREDIQSICEGDPDCIENFTPTPVPNDEWVLIPRFIVEVVVKL